MNDRESNFFIFTNPLFRIYFILYAIRYLFIMLSTYIGISDWYFILFKLRRDLKNDENLGENLKYVNENRIFKFFWLRQKAWDRVIKIIEDETK